MAIMLNCTCGRTLVVADEYAGQQGQCPACHRLLDIPDPYQPQPTWGGPNAEAVQQTPDLRDRETTPVGSQTTDTQPTWLGPIPDRPVAKPRRTVRRVVIGVLIVAGLVWGLIQFGPRLFGHKWGQRLAVSGLEEVYYKDVSQDEARRLGNALKEFGYFDGRTRNTVQLSRRDGHYVITFVVKDGTWFNGDAVDFLWLLGLKLSTRVFTGQPVNVRVCDKFMDEKKWLEVSDPQLGKWLAVSPREDLYYRGLTDAEARSLGQQLQQLRQFDGNADRTVLVARDAAAVTFTFCVQDWDKPEVVDSLRITCLELAARVFDGQPTKLRLCDSSLTLKKMLKLDHENLGKWLAISPLEDIYYRQVPEDQARKLGDVLKRVQYFTGQHETMVLLAREGERLQFTFCLKDGEWDNPETIRFFHWLGPQLRAEFTDTANAVIHLVDSRLRVQKTLAIG